jgi:hypothetical protein
MNEFFRFLLSALHVGQAASMGRDRVAGKESLRLPDGHTGLQGSCLVGHLEEYGLFRGHQGGVGFGA